MYGQKDYDSYQDDYKIDKISERVDMNLIMWYNIKVELKSDNMGA